MIIKLFEDYINIPYEEQKSEIEFCFDSLKDKWGIIDKSSPTTTGKSVRWDKKTNPFTGQYSLYKDNNNRGWFIRIEMPHLTKEKKKDFEKDLNIFRIRLSSSFSIFKGREEGKRKFNYNIYQPVSWNKCQSCAVNIWEFYIEYNNRDITWDHLESFNIHENDSFYKQISEQEVSGYLTDNSIRWDNDTVIKKLKHHFPGIKVIDRYLSRYYLERDEETYITKSVKYVKALTCFHFNYNSEKTNWFQNSYILPIDDDYYIVIHESWYDVFDEDAVKDVKYYKCDQFDGLIKFLKDHQIVRWYHN